MAGLSRRRSQGDAGAWGEGWLALALVLAVVLATWLRQNVIRLAVALLVLVAVLAVARWVILLVLYVSADAETRVSMRQARRIRRRWRRLSHMLGLSVVEQPTGWSPAAMLPWHSDGTALHVPGLRVEADEYGVIATAQTLPRVGREQWVKAAPHLADAWGCVRVAVTQERPGQLVIRAVRRDPLTERYNQVPS